MPGTLVEVVGLTAGLLLGRGAFGPPLNWLGNVFIWSAIWYRERLLRVLGFSGVASGVAALYWAAETQFDAGPSVGDGFVGHLTFSPEMLVTLFLGGPEVTDQWVRLAAVVEGFVGVFVIAVSRAVHHSTTYCGGEPAAASVSNSSRSERQSTGAGDGPLGGRSGEDTHVNVGTVPRPVCTPHRLGDRQTASAPSQRSSLREERPPGATTTWRGATVAAPVGPRALAGASVRLQTGGVWPARGPATAFTAPSEADV